MRTDRETVAKVVGVVLVIVATVGVSAWAWVRRESTSETGASPSASFELRERSAAGRVHVGDPDLGRHLYALHCAACHGRRGDSEGPAAEDLWPRPRDHTDGGEMEDRTDAELLAVIRDGGGPNHISVLMPAFGDGMDALDLWSLVAYVRTLHPHVQDAFPTADRWERREVLLPLEVATLVAESAGRSQATPSDHKIVYFDAYDGGLLLGRVAFPRLTRESIGIRLVVASDAQARPVVARTHRVVTTRDGLSPIDDLLDLGDRAGDLEAELAGLARATFTQLAAAPAVHATELARADALWAKADDAPDELPRDQRLFVSQCGHCHGPTGMALAARSATSFRPRNLADGSTMNPLSDEYLRMVIKHGGPYWNLSVMPQHPLSDAELDALVRYLRSLAVPPQVAK